MLNSPTLDVAIGLAHIFLLLSLLVSAVCEMLAEFFKWRAANLWDGIEQLLQSKEARTLVQSARCRVPGSACSNGCWVPGAECRVPGAS